MEGKDKGKILSRKSCKNKHLFFITVEICIESHCFYMYKARFCKEKDFRVFLYRWYIIEIFFSFKIQWNI